MFKPDDTAQRAERTRAEQAKEDEKFREREEATARRKAGHDAADAAPCEMQAPREGG